jgi:hydroxylamine reductase
MNKKLVAVLLALLYLGFKNIRLGPTLPGFLSPNVANVLTETFGLHRTTDADSDIAAMFS